MAVACMKADGVEAIGVEADGRFSPRAEAHRHGFMSATATGFFREVLRTPFIASTD